jgi:hypothetical protein
VWRSAGHVAGSAATIALIAPNPGDARSRDLIQYDLGQATMSITLAAADLGIGSAHAAVSDQELARRLLGVPEDRFCAWLIALGVPADRPLRPSQASSSGPRGPFLKIAWTHLGLGSSGKGLSATTWASSARVRTMTLGCTPKCWAMARSSAAAIVAVSASSLVKTTLPL